MAPNAFGSYSTSELNRTISALNDTISALNDTKLTLTFKLNLLRSSASSSPIHLATFDDLVDRLVNTGSQIWGLEEQNKNNESGANIGDDGEEVRKALKSVLVLVGTLDMLGEKVMRLKFALEGVEKAAVSSGKNTLQTATAAGIQGGAAGGSQNIAKAATTTLPQEDIATGASPNLATSATSTHEEQRLLKFMVRAISESLIALAYHASASSGRCSGDCWIWQELGVPKQVKVPNWAPEGYYYVKAHFRRKPKRKIKQEGAEAERKEIEQPASVEIVHLDGV